MGNTLTMKLQLLLTACLTLAITARLTCKNDCRSALVEGAEQNWNGKIVSNRKFCNLTCKTNNKCPRKRDPPRACKKCKKQCFRESIEGSEMLQKFNAECKPFCDEVCWGPNWKSDACTTCVTQNCAGELF